MKVFLVSTYELGRQPFGLASPAAWLTREGVDVTCLDLSRERFTPRVAEADLVAFYLPMHTATRLAVPVISRIRQLNSEVVICCYGLYAPLNDAFLRSLGVSHVFGGEFEADLTGLVTGRISSSSQDQLPRLKFQQPLRSKLPPLARYATLQHGGRPRVAGYTEASRGCKHTCRHCPVVPVYQGKFRVVAPDVVVADVEAQVVAGAEHITFGDPDFFNGVGHARRVVEEVARRCPGVTYDVTVKIEHLLDHAELLPLLRDTGCLFVTSAFESFDDEILQRLGKGHSRNEIERAVEICGKADIPLVPTFVPFTPWTTRPGYQRFLAEIERLELIEHVAPIQLAIRLLVTSGSGLLELDELAPFLQPYDGQNLLYPWQHADPKMDQLAEEIEKIVGERLNVRRRDVFRAVWERAHDGETQLVDRSEVKARVNVPYFNEPWYC
jgi:radical SAM superfamily enzyme YgiQ (UPF0313 family)